MSTISAQVKKVTSTTIFDVLRFNLKAKEVSLDLGAKRIIMKNGNLTQSFELETKRAKIKGKVIKMELKDEFETKQYRLVKDRFIIMNQFVHFNPLLNLG
jgi:hypothetical protein